MRRLMVVLITAGFVLAGCNNAPNKPPKPIAEVGIS